MIDKFDQSENKLFKICEIKKKEVSEQVSKIIEFIRLMEEDFYGEIEEFKKNRLKYNFEIISTCHFIV
jgi:hypothetical protein